MPELLPPTLFVHLKKIAGLFVWRRKTLHNAIVRELDAACQKYARLFQQHENTLQQVQSLSEDRQNLHAELIEKCEAISAKERALSELQIQHDRQKRTLSEVREKHDALLSEMLERQMKYDKQELELSELHAQHGDTWTRYDLVSRLLAARPSEHPSLTRFRELLENDFMTFAENVSMKTEAKALHSMQSIGKELEMLTGFPDIKKRSVVAIVGGFSSGKSAFINSFIDDPIRLSVGIQPVTVIPSYVFAVNKGQQVIRGHCANHGHIELEPEFYQGLSHAFIDTFDFDLRGLMPFVCLGVNMDTARFGNLCFIDTPGYNPPATSSDYSQGDKSTAVEFAQQANAIVWLIGLDATGTVPTSDIDFIHEIGHEGKPIYVVLNKADTKPEDQLEDIMDEVEDILVNEEGFDVRGICTYSSVQRRVFGCRKLELADYFVQINKPSDASTHLRERLNAVFDMYDEAIQADLTALNKKKRAIKRLETDLVKLDGFDLLDKMEDSIETMKADLETGVSQEHLKTMLTQSRSLREAFLSLEDVFGVAEKKGNQVNTAKKAGTRARTRSLESQEKTIKKNSNGMTGETEKVDRVSRREEDAPLFLLGRAMRNLIAKHEGAP